MEKTKGGQLHDEFCTPKFQPCARARAVVALFTTMLFELPAGWSFQNKFAFILSKILLGHTVYFHFVPEPLIETRAVVRKEHLGDELFIDTAAGRLVTLQQFLCKRQGEWVKKQVNLVELSQDLTILTCEETPVPTPNLDDFPIQTCLKTTRFYFSQTVWYDECSFSVDNHDYVYRVGTASITIGSFSETILICRDSIWCRSKLLHCWSLYLSGSPQRNFLALAESSLTSGNITNQSKQTRVEDFLMLARLWNSDLSAQLLDRFVRSMSAQEQINRTWNKAEAFFVCSIVKMDKLEPELEFLCPSTWLVESFSNLLREQFGLELYLPYWIAEDKSCALSQLKNETDFDCYTKLSNFSRVTHLPRPMKLE